MSISRCYRDLSTEVSECMLLLNSTHNVFLTANKNKTWQYKLIQESMKRRERRSNHTSKDVTEKKYKIRILIIIKKMTLLRLFKERKTENGQCNFLKNWSNYISFKLTFITRLGYLVVIENMIYSESLYLSWKRKERKFWRGCIFVFALFLVYGWKLVCYFFRCVLLTHRARTV